LPVASLLEPQVVVDADTGESRDLGAAKARHPSSALSRDADILGLELFAS
jgi:hypothetical protein